MLRVYTLLLLACIFLPGTISAQLRLTLEGGIAVADFDREPLLPAATRTVFGLADSQTEHFDPLESGYIGLGMAHHPADKPWGLILGLDEYTPGNKLKLDSRRKCMVLSSTLKEVGQTAISSGLGWLTPLCVRSAPWD